VKELVWDRLTGYREPIMNLEIPPSVPLMLFLGDKEGAGRVFAQMMKDFDNGMTDEDMRSYGIMPDDVDVLLENAPSDGDILYQGAPKRKTSGQMGMFGAGEDLPLFSGVAQTGKESVYNPKPEDVQGVLPGMEAPKPEMGGAIEGGEASGPLFAGKLFQSAVPRFTKIALH